MSASMRAASRRARRISRAGKPARARGPARQAVGLLTVAAVRSPAGWADTPAAAVTTPTEAAATASRPIACRAGPRVRPGPRSRTGLRSRTGPRARAGLPALEMLFARLLAARMLALMSLLPPPMAVPYVYFPSA